MKLLISTCEINSWKPSFTFSFLDVVTAYCPNMNLFVEMKTLLEMQWTVFLFFFVFTRMEYTVDLFLVV